MAIIEQDYRAGKGVREFKTIRIKELNGIDEQIAGKLADDIKKATGSESASVFNEMVRRSIVSVDGVKVNVGFPFAEWDEWSVRARNYVLGLYNEMNAVDEEDLKKAIAEAAAKNAPTLKATDGKRSEG